MVSHKMFSDIIQKLLSKRVFFPLSWFSKCKTALASQNFQILKESYHQSSFVSNSSYPSSWDELAWLTVQFCTSINSKEFSCTKARSLKGLQAAISDGFHIPSKKIKGLTRVHYFAACWLQLFTALSLLLQMFWRHQKTTTFSD